MHRLFLLRAYGDFVILLQALLESPQKNKYSLIASKHLEPLYQELALVINVSSIQIQFIDFGITNTQLSLFTNKHILSLNVLKELKQIKNFVKQNPNTEGTDYIEQDKRIGLFNAITGLNFNSDEVDNVVTFNGTTAIVEASSTTSIITKVPAGASSGKISVNVNGVTVYSTLDFTVLQIIPDDTSRFVESVKVRYLQGFGPPTTCISYTIVDEIGINKILNSICKFN